MRVSSPNPQSTHLSTEGAFHWFGILQNHLHSRTPVLKLDLSSEYFRNLEIKGGILDPCLAIPGHCHPQCLSFSVVVPRQFDTHLPYNILQVQCRFRECHLSVRVIHCGVVLVTTRGVSYGRWLKLTVKVIRKEESFVTHSSPLSLLLPTLSLGPSETLPAKTSSPFTALWVLRWGFCPGLSVTAVPSAFCFHIS